MLSDEEIIFIRDEHLPSQGQAFDCIAFARAIEVRVRADTLEQAANVCEEMPVKGPGTCASAIRAMR